MKIPHLRGCELQDAGSQMSIVQSRLLTRAGGNWPEFAFFARRRLTFVVSVSAPQEWNFVEDMLLEPLQPEINHRRDKQRDQLRKNQTPNNHQSERTSRGSILPKTKSEWNRAHQRRQRRHHDRSKTFDAGFVNCRAQIPAFIDSLQSEIDHHDTVFLHDAEQKKKPD